MSLSDKIIQVRGAEDNSMSYCDAIGVKFVKQSIKNLKDYLWNNPEANYMNKTDFEMLQLVLEKVD